MGCCLAASSSSTFLPQPTFDPTPNFKDGLVDASTLQAMWPYLSHVLRRRRLPAQLSLYFSCTRLSAYLGRQCNGFPTSTSNDNGFEAINPPPSTPHQDCTHQQGQSGNWQTFTAREMNYFESLTRQTGSRLMPCETMDRFKRRLRQHSTARFERVCETKAYPEGRTGTKRSRGIPWRHFIFLETCGKVDCC